MPIATKNNPPGGARRFRRLAGFIPLIAVLALMATVARSGTETQGGSKNPPPGVRLVAVTASADAASNA